MRNLICLFFLFFSVKSFSAVQSLVIIPDETKVTFTAIGRPAFLKINGVANEVRSELSFSQEDMLINGNVKIVLSKMETGISLRDEHMRDNYLHVSKYPEAILKVDNLKIDKTKKFKGLLELHGEKKVVEVEIEKIKERGDSVLVEASFVISLEDFKIDIPSYQGITIAKNVNINVKLNLKKEKTENE